MSDCIFCRIAARTAQAEVVWESPHALAFLDRNPAARGHTMIIPRSHAPTLLDLDDSAVGPLFLAVKIVTGKIAAALRPAGFHVGWNHGAAAGQHVQHLHVHVIPRSAPGGRGIQLLGEGDQRGDVADVARAIRGA